MKQPSREETRSTNRRLLAFVVAVDALALAAVLLLSRDDLFRAPATFAIMVALAALTGHKPIRIRALRTTVSASDPFLFACLAALGGLPSVVVGLASVLSSAISTKMRISPQKLIFNLAAAAISISAASWIYEQLSLGAAGNLQRVFPLFAATTTYFLVITSLVAAAIAIDRGESFFATWAGAGLWVAVINYSGTTLAVMLLFLLDRMGPAGLVLGVPPLWLFVAYFRSHRARLREQQYRMDQVLESNQRLEERVQARTKELAGKVVELQRAKNQLRELALTDDLTLLPNRRRFQQTLARELARAKRFDRQLSILLIDVDHFKRINDDYGHPMGDLVLQQLATTLDHNVRHTDLAARYGGEEFGIVLAETPKTGALTVANQLRRRVAERPFGVDDQASPTHLTISIGVATYPEDATDAENLISTADRRLYRAKEDGRDRVIA